VPEILGEFNRGGVLFLGDWPQWAIASMIVLAVLVCVLTYLDVSEMRRTRRVALVSLRAAVLSLALFVLLEPALELEQVSVVPNHVAVIVDVSESQTLETVEGETRQSRSSEAIEAFEQEFGGDTEDHIFHYLALSDLTESATAEELAAWVPDGDSTHILAGIERFVAAHGARDVGGIVIVSDGIDNGALGARVRRGEELDAETLELLQSFGAPVHTISTAQAGEIRDIAIERVVHDDFAFVRNAVAVSADLKVLGFTQGVVNVTLRREGELLQTRSVPLEPGRTDYRVDFEFVPELIGKEIYAVDVDLLEGEALETNNRELFVLNVIRDKIRVLQVVGRPSWDVRFMRQLLQNNPNVDLICFFILRTQDDIHRGSERELSLIPFPTDELFNEELGSFDLVVFQNFDYGPYNMRQYLPQISDYVRDGGGFAMIGGDRSFSSGGYAGTAVADILPVELPSGSSADLVDESSFRPVLTDAGQRHPITRLEFDAVDNAELWGELPPLRGTNRVLAPREGAVVLAEHPSLQAGAGAMPVITVADIGEGRSMAVTYDSSWRWNFEHVSRGGASGPYTGFWNSAIRWLIRDPALNLVDVELSEEVVAPNETLVGNVRVFGPDYAPLVDASLTLIVTRRPLENLGEEPVVFSEQFFRSNDRGTARFELGLPEPGAYSVRARMEDESGDILEDTEVFLVVRRSRELRDIEPRAELLEALSDATDGRHLTDPSRAGSLRFSEPRVEEVDRREVIDLWSSPWFFALLGGLLAIEWSLRRRWGRL
jgi:uncharacterized membrane protein